MSQPTKPDFLQHLSTLGIAVLSCGREFRDGVRTRSLPVGNLLLTASALQLTVLLQLDRLLFAKLSLIWLYPTSPKGFLSYYLVLIGTPFFIWAITRMLQRRRLMERLEDVFQSSGLKNNLGKPPRFLFDRPLDAVTRKLRVTSAVLPISAFQKAKPALESGLHVFIDEFREIRKLGAVEIIYAHEPMPGIYQPDFLKALPSAAFRVGTTRSREVRASLNETPHLLVAGQTGGGKSTFLRQLVTSLYLAADKPRFLLIDLKGGLEFQLFEGLERVMVPDSMAKAVTCLVELSREVEKRMQLLKSNRAKDLEAYKRAARESDGKLPRLARQIIIVDEAAEMFLAGQHASGANIQLAKRVLSQVARQGRSLGIHLVVATQRPDSRALDPQVKANLPGVLCFQMVNDISSITVLGNGRATDLPAIPGRAIWKAGAEMMEVQTPFLPLERAEDLLRPHKGDTPVAPANAGAKGPKLRQLDEGSGK